MANTHIDKQAVLDRMAGQWPDFYGQHTPLKQVGAEWRGPCPLHGGDGPNFAVDPVNGTWYCHSQCKEGGDIFEFIERVESMSFPEALKHVANWANVPASSPPATMPGGARNKAEDRIVAVYDYTDEAGGLLFQVQRIAQKKFWQRRPNGKNGWIPNLDGVRRVLYRLPEVIAAVRANKTIYLVEGEKDADNLRKLGFVATCNPHGAGPGKWLPEYTAFLQGADVVIIPDNDAPGREHAELVAAAVKPVAGRVRVLSLPDLKPKGDFSDWLAAGGTPEELRRLTDATPDWEPSSAGSVASVESDGWELPVPFGGHRLPPFPVDVLPDVLAAFVADVAACTQVPVDMPALLALAVVAAAGARRFKVQIGNTHGEPLNLYVCIVMEPGNRKSATLDTVAAPLRNAEREMLSIATPAINAAREQRGIQEKRLANLRDSAARGKEGNEADKLTQDVITLAGSLVEVPVTPRLLADDITPEKLGAIMAEHAGTMAILSAEGGIFSILAGRYSNGKVNLDLFLKAHSGDEYRVDRKGSASILIPKCCLTMGLTVQQDVMSSLANTPAFLGRGLLGRFLYSVPDDLVGTRMHQDRRPDYEAARLYEAAISRILNYPPCDPNETGARYVLRLEGAAWAVWKKFGDEVEKRQAVGCDLAVMRDWASKLAGAVARIAGGLHLFENAGCSCPWSIPISENTVLAAWAIAEYLIPHAQCAYGQVGADPSFAMARKILKWIERSDQTEFTLRDCHQAHRTASSSSDLVSPLEILCERGYVRRKVETDQPVRGRPKSTTFEVNPLVLGIGAAGSHGDSDGIT